MTTHAPDSGGRVRGHIDPFILEQIDSAPQVVIYRGNHHVSAAAAKA